MYYPAKEFYLNLISSLTFNQWIWLLCLSMFIMYASGKIYAKVLFKKYKFRNFVIVYFIGGGLTAISLFSALDTNYNVLAPIRFNSTDCLHRGLLVLSIIIIFICSFFIGAFQEKFKIESKAL